MITATVFPGPSAETAVRITAPHLLSINIMVLRRKKVDNTSESRVHAPIILILSQTSSDSGYASSESVFYIFVMVMGL